MTLAAVMTVRWEADIIRASVEHLFAEGVDYVMIALGRSDDGTLEVIAELMGQHGERLGLYPDGEEVHYQDAWTNRLAGDTWAINGAEWILPCDADEFHTAGALSLGEFFRQLPPDVGAVDAMVYQHHDYETREVWPVPVVKVAYRYTPHVRVSPGAHNVAGYDGQRLPLAFQVRHLPYRGFEHFCRKAAQRNRTLEPSSRAWGAGNHHTRLEGLDEEAMRKEYDELMARPTVVDPIPSRLSNLAALLP